MIEAGIFLLLTILFLAIVRCYRNFALIVLWFCFGFILLDFLFHGLEFRNDEFPNRFHQHLLFKRKGKIHQ